MRVPPFSTPAYVHRCGRSAPDAVLLLTWPQGTGSDKAEEPGVHVLEGGARGDTGNQLATLRLGTAAEPCSLAAAPVPPHLPPAVAAPWRRLQGLCRRPSAVSSLRRSPGSTCVGRNLTSPQKTTVVTGLERGRATPVSSCCQNKSPQMQLVVHTSVTGQQKGSRISRVRTAGPGPCSLAESTLVAAGLRHPH